MGSNEVTAVEEVLFPKQYSLLTVTGDYSGQYEPMKAAWRRTSSENDVCINEG